MSTLFASFPKTSKEDWVQLLQKELKGASLDTLQKLNRVEEIAFPAYFHTEDAPARFSDPGAAPFTRGNTTRGNDWLIGTCFRIGDERTTNKAILQALMAGTTALVLHAETEQTIDFAALLAEVGMEYIHTTFYAQTPQQAREFLRFAGNHPSALAAENTALISEAKAAAAKPVRPFAVNGYSVQQAGGTTWQELSIALAEGHDLLVAQIVAGLSTDEAAANIHFVFGVGNKYFFEIAKLRAFRTAWSRIVKEYAPAKTESMQAFITVQTGFTNVSLKDPYTNLLRQTTESMSAVVGGTDLLVIQPYDWHAATPQTTFTQRMATNISLLLKEESYLDKVIDPAGGSYALDDLTHAIAERAWAEFQRIEATGGIAAMKDTLSEEIQQKAQQRLDLIHEKKETLIGINVFPNPETTDYTWKPLPAAWSGLPSLNIETALHP